jgi:hypothetical protein
VASAIESELTAAEGELARAPLDMAYLAQLGLGHRLDVWREAAEGIIESAV